MVIKSLTFLINGGIIMPSIEHFILGLFIGSLTLLAISIFYLGGKVDTLNTAITNLTSAANNLAARVAALPTPASLAAATSQIEAVTAQLNGIAATPPTA